MELNNKERKLLAEWGNNAEDIKAIEHAINNGMEFISDNTNRHISAETAKRMLGTKEFLSGAERATFHASAGRENKGKRVSFSYKFWI